MSSEQCGSGLIFNRHGWKHLYNPKDDVSPFFRICRRCGRCEKAIWAVRNGRPTSYEWQWVDFTTLKTQYSQAIAEYEAKQTKCNAEADAAIAFVKELEAGK